MTIIIEAVTNDEGRAAMRWVRREVFELERGIELRSPWSNGQVEGQLTRLKRLKRQMDGRANLDLLKARVLHKG